MTNNDSGGKSYDNSDIGSIKSGSESGDDDSGKNIQLRQSEWDRHNRYKLIGEISSGGMGSVWRAFDSYVGREVALKFARGPTTLALLNDARTAAALQHPNIAPIYDLQPDVKPPFFSMRLASAKPEETSLEDAISACTDRFDSRFLLEILVDVCRAIDYAHRDEAERKPQRHLDLKPRNVVLAANNVPLVIDWGLARIGNATQMGDDGEPDSARIAHTTVLGTYAYMSPEQASGNLAEIDNRTDVYGLGTILFQILTGCAPHNDARRATLKAKIIDSQTPRASQTTSGVPAGLDEICAKAMCKEKKGRYQSAGALASDIDLYLAGKKLSVTEPFIARVRRVVKYNRVFAQLVATTAILLLVALVITVGALVVTSLARKDAVEKKNLATEAQKSESAQRSIAEKQKQIAQDEAEDARYSLYVADMGGIQNASESGRLDRMLTLLDVHQPRGGEKDLRGFEWYYFWRLAHRNQRTFRGHSDIVASVVMSPDGRLIATGSKDNTVRLWDLKTGNERKILRGHTSTVVSVAFSGDGNLFASGGESDAVKLWDVVTGKEQHSLPGHGPVALSRGGDLLASLIDPSTIIVRRLMDSAEVATLKGHRSSIYALAFAPDGKTLASVGQDGTLRQWSLDTKTEIRSIRHTPNANSSARINCLAFAPDGNSIVSGSTMGRVVLWNLLNNEQLQMQHPEQIPVYSVCFLDNGNLLVTGDLTGTVRVLSAKTGTLRSTILAHTSTVYSLAPSPNGKEFISGSWDHSAKLWNVSDILAPETIRGHAKRVSSIKFTSDSKVVATGSDDGTVKLWNVSLMAEQKSIALHQPTKQVWCLDISPDGSTLASGSDDKTVRLSNLSGELAATLEQPGRVHSLEFASDEKTLVVATIDNHVSLWNVATKDRRATFEGPLKSISGIAISSDAEVLAIAGYQQVPGKYTSEISLVDLKSNTKRSIATGRDGKIERISFVDGRNTLVCASAEPRRFSGELSVWDVVTGECKVSYTGNMMSSFALSPDERFVAVGSTHNNGITTTGVIILWDLKTGRERSVFKGHDSPVSAVAFAPDGMTLVSGAYDGAVKFWRADSKENVTEFEKAGSRSVTKSETSIVRTQTQFDSNENQQAIVVPPPTKVADISSNQKLSQLTGAKNGLLAELYNGADFETPVKKRIDSQVDWAWAWNAPDSAMEADRFSIRWTGFLRAPKAGRYKIITVSDDAIRVWIDDHPIINDWRGHLPTRNEALIELTERPHKIKVEYSEDRLTAVVVLRWQYEGGPEATIPPEALFHDLEAARRYVPPNKEPVTGSILAHNYLGTDFQELVSVEHHHEIGWFWGWGAPTQRYIDEGMSIRWTGILQPPSPGRCILIAVTDDGARVSVNGTLVINEWRRQHPLRSEVPLDLTGQPVTLEVEYYNDPDSPGYLTLRWIPPSGFEHAIPASAFLPE